MKKVHFLGIGGSGASAIASIAKEYGYSITGCDHNPNNEYTLHIYPSLLMKGHSPEHLEGIDILAVTPAIFTQDPKNEELLEAKKRGIEVLTWQEFMGKYLEEGKFVIAVTGTHGKSTTTAMIGTMLQDANLDPTVELGAVVPKWNQNFRAGNSKFFVTEADEFNDNFLVSHPDITILTTVEMDHPEYFADFEAVKESFLEFLYQTKLKIIANLSDPGVQEVMTTFQKNKDKPHYPEIIDYSKSEINFPLRVIGEYNKLNATAAFQLGLSLGIDPTTIRTSLMSFTGIQRRFEFLGKFKEAEVYSDFGHHPTEVKLTVEAIRQRYPQKRIVLIFQPHMFSRTKVLFEDFVKVFAELPVDQIYITDIFASREKDKGIVNSKELVDTLFTPKIAYSGNLKMTGELLKVSIRKDDVVIFMGAGTIDKLARNLVKNG